MSLSELKSQAEKCISDALSLRAEIGRINSRLDSLESEYDSLASIIDDADEDTDVSGYYSRMNAVASEMSQCSAQLKECRTQLEMVYTERNTLVSELDSLAAAETKNAGIVSQIGIAGRNFNVDVSGIRSGFSAKASESRNLISRLQAI